MKSENLNFLEPSGPLQACYGTVAYYKIIWHALPNETDFIVTVVIASNFTKQFQINLKTREKTEI